MTTPNFKPLLAYTVEDTSKISYPCYASVKLDGIRVIILDGVVYSRSMKPIRSKVVQKLFGKPELNGIDAEVLYGPWEAPNVFNVTTSAVMSTNLPEGFSEGLLSLAVFDLVEDMQAGYDQRYVHASERVDSLRSSQVKLVEQRIVSTEEQLLKFEQETLDAGFEGLMVRSISGKYKQGRATAKEGIIGKIKRFSDDEAVVTGFEEKMHNTNEAKTNELGRTQRSQAQEGMVGTDTLGALICECSGIKFTCGSGLDDALRKEIWNNRDKYLGSLITFKHFAIGRKDSFRFPIFKGFRDEDDV